MVTTGNEEIPINEPTFDDNGALLAEVEAPSIDLDLDEARRPAGEAGLFGDPRPADATHDDDPESEPEVVRS